MIKKDIFVETINFIRDRNDAMNKLNKARSTTLRKRTTAHELDLYLDTIDVQSCMIKLFISGVIISCLLSFGL